MIITQEKMKKIEQRAKAYSFGDSPDILVRDNGEPLVDVREFCPNAKIALAKERMAVEKTAWVRKSVAERLAEAQRHLPKGMRFVIRDAWRPSYIQCKIYFDFFRKAAKRFPHVDPRDQKREIEKYVAPWKGRNASGHMTGGAVDLRILLKTGHLLPMRSKKLTYQENALSNQPKLPDFLKKNRAILFFAMESVGFSNYPMEFWHWTIGDFYWAKRNGRKETLYAQITDINDIYANCDCPCESGKKYKKCCGK